MNVVALDYAAKGLSYVVVCGEGGTPVKRAVKRSEVPEFVSGLTPDDCLVTELGGAVWPIVRVAYDQCGEIWRIPTLKVSEERDRRGWERARDAELLFSLWQRHPDWFYPVLEPNDEVLRLTGLVRRFLNAQKERKEVVKRVREDIKWENMIAGVLLTEEEVDALTAEHPRVKRAFVREEARLAEVEKLLRKMPLYGEVFEPMWGVGPSIGGRFIASIRDMRRFRDRDALFSNTGFSFFPTEDENEEPDPRVLRYASEHGGLHADPFLTQAVWLYVKQVRRWGPHDVPEKQMYLALVGRERAEYPEMTDAVIKNRAERKLGRKIVYYIYSRWNAWLDGRLEEYERESAARLEDWLAANEKYIALAAS